jgi:TonB family protein
VNSSRLVVITILLVVGATAALFASDGIFPKPISSELPMYPERARSARVAGTVKIWFVLDGSGEVTQAQSVSGNPMLRDAAVSTVKSWKFLTNSVQANVRYETEFVYVLNVQPKNGEPKLTVSMTDFRRVEIVSERYAEAIE